MWIFPVQGAGAADTPRSHPAGDPADNALRASAPPGASLIEPRDEAKETRRAVLHSSEPLTAAGPCLNLLPILRAELCRKVALGQQLLKGEAWPW